MLPIFLVRILPHGEYISCLCLSILFLSCNSGEEKIPISLVWKDDQAVSVQVSKSIITEIKGYEEASPFNIKVSSSDAGLFVLGDYTEEHSQWIFTPIVPFTRGIRYIVINDGNAVGEFEVPAVEDAPVPVVMALYPSLDTLPENLLKMYIRFSVPMRESSPLDYIDVIRDETDTLDGIFLNLQPALWDEEGTILTLWIDPGRVKRDLIPNKEQGIPLVKGNHYSLAIAASWKSKEGVSLRESIIHKFYIGARDVLSPDPEKWRLVLPLHGTTKPLEIQFGESLDHELAGNSFHVLNQEKNEIEGTISVVDGESAIRFIPINAWKKGKYIIECNARLEDLAGNNLNRPFDRDLHEPGTIRVPKEVYTRVFEIQ